MNFRKARARKEPHKLPRKPVFTPGSLNFRGRRSSPARHPTPASCLVVCGVSGGFRLRLKFWIDAGDIGP